MKLKAMLIAGVVAASMAGGSLAGERHSQRYDEMTGLEILAEQTGLRERQVQMILGTRSSFPEYITSFDRVHQKYVEAGGPSIYGELQSAGYFDADRNRRIAANRRAAAETAALN
jgi:hypothetical protein